MFEPADKTIADFCKKHHYIIIQDGDVVSRELESAPVHVFSVSISTQNVPADAMV